MKSLLYLGCPTAERTDAERVLAAADLSVVWADTLSSATAELQRRDMPVLVDLSRGAAALQIARDLRTLFADVLIFAVVDEKRPDLTTEAVLAGLADVFARPLAGRRVANAIAREQSNGTGRADGDRDAVEDLYCHSAAMRDVQALVTRASAMRAGVLLRGENGTGRQVVARAIHAAGRSNGARFVAIDCAAYDADELEAALFGTAARGPGAADIPGGALERVTRDGGLHEALGGTLYLQNLAEAPTRVQGRLARALRDREAHLLETGEAIALDVRPMAGVEPAFDAAVQDGRVRSDLFRRLSVIRIEIPPLRNRREDIPALANYFVREICADLRVPPKTLSRPALSLIAALPWRGNAVELRAVFENVVNAVDGGRGIGIDDVLAHVRLDGGAAVTAVGTLRQARARFEHDYIAAVLEQHRYRIPEAAKALGIQRTNLYRKMRSLRVTRGAGL